MCDKFTVHERDDKVCLNQHCPSNARKKASASASCANCYTRLYNDEVARYGGYCSNCYVRAETQRQKGRPTGADPYGG